MMAYNNCALSLTTTMTSSLNYTPLTSWNEGRVQIPIGTPFHKLFKNYLCNRTLQFAFLLRVSKSTVSAHTTDSDKTPTPFTLTSGTFNPIPIVYRFGIFNPIHTPLIRTKCVGTYQSQQCGEGGESL